MSQPGTTTDQAATGGSTLTVLGDVRYAQESSAAHAAYADAWTKGATFLDQSIDLDGWTGEAADAARAKLRGMRSLMQAHALNLTEMSAAERKVAIEANRLHADINREKAASDTALAVSSPGAGATYTGIAVQGFINLALKWVNGGRVLSASVRVGDRWSAAVFRDAASRRQLVVARLLAAGVFVGANIALGAISAAFFELGAVRDGNGAVFRGERGVMNTLIYAGAGSVGTGAAIAANYTSVRTWNQVAVFSGIGAVSGALGGFSGPYVIMAFPGTPIPFGGIVAASGSVNTAAGAMPAFGTTVQFAAAQLRAIGARITPTRIAPPVPEVELVGTGQIDGGAGGAAVAGDPVVIDVAGDPVVTDVAGDDPVAIDIDDTTSTSSGTSYQTASTAYYDALEQAGDDPNG